MSNPINIEEALRGFLQLPHARTEVYRVSCVDTNDPGNHKIVDSRTVISDDVSSIPEDYIDSLMLEKIIPEDDGLYDVRISVAKDAVYHEQTTNYRH